jgi:anaerobic selenocysteine-containing dehydrogenase
MHQEPVVTLHPQTAEAFGIAAGDMVAVETRRGRIVQKAHIDPDMEPRVIGVDYGWWFPEREKEGLFGWDEANVNVLIDDSGPAGKELGTPALRAIRCRISKVVE